MVEHAAHAPHHLATIGLGQRKAITYVDLLERVDRASLALLERGVHPGDVVSVQLPNWPEYVVLLLAIERIGAVMNPLSTILRQHELGQMLGIADSRVFVVPDTFRGFDHATMAMELASITPSLNTVVVAGSHAPAGAVLWDDFLGELARPVDPRDRAWLDYFRPDANDVTELAFTSGTTGVPKGVLHTHNTAVSTVESTRRRQAVNSKSVVLIFTPVGHNAGYFYGVRIALHAGASIVFQDVFDPEETLSLIERHRVTFTYGAPTHLIDLLAVTDLERYDLSTLDVFMPGGASLPPSVAREAMQRLPGRLCPIFGMTEHGHSTGTDPDTPLEKVCATDGSPQPEVELRIVDGEGRRLGHHQEGRLLLRCPFNFVGYIQGRAFTEEFFTADDFFDTGDLAYLDEEGYLRVTGRVKDLIVRGGENVPVKEIEDLLAMHPSVLEVALVGVADARLGERAMACARLRTGASLSLEEVRTFLSQKKVTKQFWPEAVVVLENLPRTASGKIQKNQLRAMLTDQLGNRELS